MSLMAHLEAATAASRVRLRAAPIFEAVAAGPLPLESYVGLLRGLLALRGVIEPVVADCRDPRVRAVWRDDMAKLHRLHQDLQFFEPRTVAELREASAVTQRAADYLRLESVSNPVSLLGWLYVLEGAMRDDGVLGHRVAAALGLADGEGTAYLDAFGPASATFWEAFARRMDALSLDPRTFGGIVQSAERLLEWLDEFFCALYPFQPASRVIGVSAINPEAGQHPIPADVREVEAAIRAGDLCWQRFPYFEARYGERGLRFARSDAAWQATLHRYPPPQILQQLRWLGRVLAGRGMPTILLQVQLDILVEELVEAIPERRSDYEKLLPAAADLHQLRAAWLADEQVEQLSNTFDAAVGDAWCARYPDTGRLVCAAVADECAGSAKAVESLRSWMVDPQRFPAVWIVAIENTLAQARRLAGLKSHNGTR